MIADYIFFIFFIFLIPLIAISVLVALLDKLGITSKRIIILSFLVFGVLIGLWSFQMGKRDITYITNIPGAEPSERVYNQLLIPYWQKTLKPAKYEEIPVINLETGQRTGAEKVPQYDYPIKDVTLLYIPFSILSWGLIGLILQIIYNKFKK